MSFSTSFLYIQKAISRKGKRDAIERVMKIDASLFLFLLNVKNDFFIMMAQLTFTCSNLTIETEEGIKYVQSSQ